MSHPIKATPGTPACPSAETQRTWANVRNAEFKKICYEDVVCVNLVNNNRKKDPNTAYSSDLTLQAVELSSQGEADAASHVKDDCHPHVRC